MIIQQGTILYKIISIPGILILKIFNFLIAKLYSNNEIIDMSNYEFVKTLKSSSEIIFSEFNNLKKSEIHQVKDFYKVETNIGQDENWKGLPLVIYNYAFSENIKQCPETYKIINKIPGCTSAMFSCLGPKKHVLPHKGAHRGIIRGLLTLSMQENGDCWIRVGKSKMNFKKGEVILFDETFEHEVLNNTDEERIVLYFDIYRKFNFPMNLFNKLIFTLVRNSPLIKNIPLDYALLNKQPITKHLCKTKPIKI